MRLSALLLLFPMIGISVAAEFQSLEVPTLWDPNAPLAEAKQLPVLEGVRFSVIKKYEPDADGYRFLHGVALAWHRDRLYASFGHNKGGENTATEEARVCWSADDGRTWSKLVTIDAGPAPGLGVSHGVFLERGGELWAFHGSYSGTLQHVHTRAYRLNDADGSWQAKGTVIAGGFWPLGEPVRLDNGNWLMAGIRVGERNPAAVAISRGDDLTSWDLVVIPLAAGLTNVWGESAAIVDGSNVTCLARYGGKPLALVARSADSGRTWTTMDESNLPMTTSKPCAGTLSTGERFLVCTTAANNSGRRHPLTIALSRPGETVFSRVSVIRPAEFPGGPGESHPKAALAYPCAMEHDGKLYVGYSNSGGGAGRKGAGRALANNNSAELAVIPLDVLRRALAP